MCRLHTLYFVTVKVKGTNPVAHDSRDGSAVICLLGLWVWIPSQAWWSVSCECCILSGRGLCDGLITRPEYSYLVLCVWVWSWSFNNGEALAHLGLSHIKNLKGRVVPVHTMQECGGNRSIAPLIPNLSTVWKWVVSFTLRSLYPKK